LVDVVARGIVVDQEARMLTVGEQAPSFTVKDQDGELVSLSHFVGKRVVLWFYPKADTPG
jgi:peroxiredoxin Q/BCP